MPQTACIPHLKHRPRSELSLDVEAEVVNIMGAKSLAHGEGPERRTWRSATKNRNPVDDVRRGITSSAADRKRKDRVRPRRIIAQTGRRPVAGVADAEERVGRQVI